MKNENTRSMRYIKEEEVKDEEVIENVAKKSSLLKKILISCIIILILIGCYASFIETNWISVKEYKVSSNILPKSFHGLKIVQFSDIHYGTTINKKQLDKIVKMINELNPDIIMFTGDLVDSNISMTDDIENEIKDSLSNLKATLYKYAIYGNEDINNEKYKDIISSIDFILLDDESKLLYYNDNNPIVITGFKTISENPKYEILGNKIDELDTTNLYKIVLCHEPDAIDYFTNYNPNLVLSGHSLGGIIKIPFFNPLFLPKTSKKYYEDYYRIDNTDFYISNGLGTSNIKIRLNNRPSINLYRLFVENDNN